MKKKLALVALLVGAFAVGYGSTAHAWPFFGRNEFMGYFSNQFDSSGGDVLPRIYDGGANAIPNSVDTVAELISFVEGNFSGSNQQRIGAAFIVDTMLGGDHMYPPSGEDMAQWRNDLYFYEAAGWISWNTAFSHNYNSLYQGAGGSGPNDDAFFAQNATSSSITFTGPGGWIRYGIRRQCANPVGTGGLAPLEHKQFSTRGYTTVSNANPTPGSTVTFSHYVVNDGPSSVWPQTMWWAAERTEPAPLAAVGGPAPDGFYDDIGVPHNVFNHPVSIPPGTSPGTRFCERVGWTPVNSWGGADGRGVPACATVIADFNLNPTVLANPTVADDGDTVTFTYRVENTGTGSSSPATCSVRDGSGAVVSVALTCNPGPQTFAGNSGVVVVGTENLTIGGQPAGTRICRRLTVNPAVPAGTAATSPEACVVVAKTPYVNFMGGDVWAGGGFATYTPACNTSAKIRTIGKALGGTSSPVLYAGSLVEYQAFALNSIYGFGTSSRILTGVGSYNNVARRYTYANSDAVNLNNLGFYGAASHCLQDYASLFSTYTSVPGGTHINVASQGSGVWRSTGDIYLTGTVPNGAKQVYISTANIFIEGNLRYSDNYANVGQIPSLAAISSGGNIAVMNNVSQMDGLYVAQGNGTVTGMLRTCWPKTSPQAVGDTCDANQLILNGAVVAGNLELWRSYGARGSTIAERRAPAELFNFNPEMYLSNPFSSSQTTIQTTNVLELPPRF